MLIYFFTALFLLFSFHIIIIRVKIFIILHYFIMQMGTCGIARTSCMSQHLTLLYFLIFFHINWWKMSIHYYITITTPLFTALASLFDATPISKPLWFSLFPVTGLFLSPNTSVTTPSLTGFSQTSLGVSSFFCLL